MRALLTLAMFISLLVAALLVAPSSGYAADLLDYTWEYNGAAPAPLTCQGNCPTASTAYAKKGSYSGKFSIAVTDPTDYRTEATFGSSVNMPYNTEWWEGFDALFIDWGQATDSDLPMTPMQQHNRDWLIAGCGLGSAVSTAPLWMGTQSNVLYIRRYQNTNMWSQSNYPKYEWHNFAWRMKFSETNGYYEAYRDGVLLSSFSGKTATQHDACGNIMGDILPKFGIYAYSNKDRPDGSEPTRVVYLDNIRIWSGAGGKEFVTGGAGGTPPPTEDTTPPTFNNQVATPLTPTTERITWGTSETTPINSVDYGLTTSYGLNKADNNAADTHAVELTGLTPSTLYNFRVRSTDASGNEAIGTNRTFTTLAQSGDVTPPVISPAVVSGVSSTTANIGWTSDEASESFVRYGLTTDYNATTGNARLVSTHNVKLIGLAPNTTYNFQCMGRDRAGNVGQNANATFTTLAAE